MTDDLNDFIALRPASGHRPLQGLTVLVVEDSRFACEAMRLLCLRSGARIRRADCLRSARRHLATYRPAVIVVDLGLPDGSGLDLIADLARAVPRVPVILGTSGSSELRDAALAAGADDFLEKPIESLAAFQGVVLRSLPAEARPFGLRAVHDETIRPDPLALQDDLKEAAGLLAEPGDASRVAYAAQFLSGVALSAHDGALEDAARAVVRDRAAAPEVTRLAGMVHDRLASGTRF